MIEGLAGEEGGGVVLLCLVEGLGGIFFDGLQYNYNQCTSCSGNFQFLLLSKKKTTKIRNLKMDFYIRFWYKQLNLKTMNIKKILMRYSCYRYRPH